MIAINNELARKVGVKESILLTYLVMWTTFNRPLPGPVKDWADHLPFTPSETTRLIDKLTGSGHVIITDEGYMPVLDIKPVKKQRKTTRAKADLSPLTDFFCQQTGLVKPEVPAVMTGGAYNKLWLTPLRQMLAAAGGDAELAKRYIGMSVRKMQTDKLTITSPASIRKIYEVIRSEGKKGISVW